MSLAGHPLDRVRAQTAQRLRWFSILHAAGVVVALAAVATLWWTSKLEATFWAFVVLAVIMPLGVPLIWWLNRRASERSMTAYEAFRPRLADTNGFLFVLDNGLVFRVEPPANVVRISAFLSAGGALLRPTAAEAGRWEARSQLREAQVIVSAKRGPEEARAELERLRTAVGARWFLFNTRQARVGRMVPGEPMWAETLMFSISQWWSHTGEIAGRLDEIASFLESAPARYASASIPAS